MPDWNELLRRASDDDPLELKRRTDLVAVCLELGIDLQPTDETQERWTGRCPFHDDTNPSFGVWWDHEDEHHRCGCWSCPFGTGDVFDFIQAAEGIDFNGAVRWVVNFLADDPPPRPQPPAPREPVDLSGYTEAAHAQAQQDLSHVMNLLAARRVDAPADWVVDQFRVGVDDEGAVVVPHLDVNGTVRAVKRRAAPAWVPQAVKGSKLDVLYGVHRVAGHERIVVCEGESDTWRVGYLLRDEDVDVVGLPSGAGPGKPPRAEWMDLLVGKQVTLLFDADDAGRAGLEEWIPKLGACAVAVAQLDEGSDASSTRRERLREVLAWARDVNADWEPGLDRTPAGILQGDRPVCNYDVELKRTIEVEAEELVFEVQLPNGRLTKLSTFDLGSDSRMVAWSNRHGYAWYGTRKQAQELFRILTVEGILKPKVQGTHVAGWHHDTFVLPHTNVGPSTCAYVPPVADVGLQAKVMELWPDPDWDRSIPQLLVNLHESAVITPILGWIAAAPLRSRCHKFPILGVVGGSGNGKTTLLETTLHTFGYDLSAMLTATTPHAVHSLAGSTNAIPVWIDEYRSGARKDARMVLEQVIRDAWDGGASLKGGLRDNRQALTSLPAIAPLVVSGEDMFSETSHVERMTLVAMPSRGRRRDVLERLQATETFGFGYAYLEWLVHAEEQGFLEAPPKILDRMVHARAVVEWGWRLLREFTRDQCGYDIGDVNMELVEANHKTSVPVILEMLGELLGVNDARGAPTVWVDADDLCVRVSPFCSMVKRDTDVQLPGGSRAVKAWLEDRWKTRDERNGWGRYVRLLGAAEEVI